MRPRAITVTSSIGNGASNEQPKKLPHPDTPSALSLSFCISQKGCSSHGLAGSTPEVGQLRGLSHLKKRWRVLLACQRFWSLGSASKVLQKAESS